MAAESRERRRRLLGQELKDASNRLHRLARSLAREAGVSIYAEDDDDRFRG